MKGETAIYTVNWTEQPDHNNIPNQLVSGITFVNNDFVNFASSLLAATMVLLFVQLQ